MLSTLVAFSSFLALAAASAQCYYPDGGLAPATDTPCQSDGHSMCCPYNWFCLSNGLCYDPNAKYLGRYTCTDRAWSDSSCPAICTAGGTTKGNEAVLKCDDGRYCCDANRSFDCCTSKNDHMFFELDDGKEVSFIDTDGKANPVGPSPTSTPQSSQSSVIKGPPPIASSRSTTSTNSDKSSSTLVMPSTLSSESTLSSSDISSPILTRSSKTTSSTIASSSTLSSLNNGTSSTIPQEKGSNKGPIIGGVLGGLAGLAAIAGFFFLFNRRKKTKVPPTATPYLFGKGQAGEGHNPNALPANPLVTTYPELDSKELPRGPAELSPETVQYARPVSAVDPEWHHSDSRPISMISPPNSATLPRHATISSIGSVGVQNYDEWSPRIPQTPFPTSPNGAGYGGHGRSVSDGAGNMGIQGHSDREDSRRFTLPDIAELP
ncbi:hypothetical protein EJ08DRAFT_691191 [Tothia fuscella]|uniref:Mid2 domain-containing protein n=1 Tax=Tothia fuscella TaxID=1048955 RepID=A0A9P4U3H5_9PEZI|nr:hypothetical protein EJ08DRAFT_691191 [Tothia fuscella]